MGLRELKKARTRQAVQKAAMRLFDEQGYKATTVEQIALAAEISTATFYNWKSKYGGLDVSEAQRLRQMEDENRRLKALVADLSLDREALKAVIRRNGWSLPSERGHCVRLGRFSSERTQGLQAAGRGSSQLSV